MHLFLLFFSAFFMQAVFNFSVLATFKWLIFVNRATFMNKSWHRWRQLWHMAWQHARKLSFISISDLLLPSFILSSLKICSLRHQFFLYHIPFTNLFLLFIPRFSDSFIHPLISSPLFRFHRTFLLSLSLPWLSPPPFRLSTPLPFPRCIFPSTDVSFHSSLLPASNLRAVLPG